MRILMLASELSPYAKTGGLGDAVSALMKGLAVRGHEVTAVLPGYSSVELRGAKRVPSATFSVDLGFRSVGCGISELRSKEHSEFSGMPPRMRVFLLEASEYFDRPGFYGVQSTDYPDNAERFACFVRGALKAARVLGLEPEIFHGHDWQAGLLPIYANTDWKKHPGQRPPIVFTIHNLAFQGLFEKSAVLRLGIAPELLAPMQALEFFGKASLLKAAIHFSDKITTVSPNYAREILMPENGMGFDGVLRARAADLKGIVNGIDIEAWNPATDPALSANFGQHDLGPKRICKAALQREIGLPVDASTMLVAWVSRLTWQKGVDVLDRIVPACIHQNVQFAMLGSGDAHLEAMVLGLASRFPKTIAVRIAFDDGLARRMFAGADAVLVPSRFEPCGLTQLYALRYGALPIVRRTGGLADTVLDCDWDPENGCGFVFDGEGYAPVLAAIDRALAKFADVRSWEQTMRHAMTREHSFDATAKAYEAVYESALGST